MLALLRRILYFLRMSWDFVESDFVTFAVPNTAFGVFSALASSLLIEDDSCTAPSALQILHRLPWILAFNVGNLLIFDLANQRAPQSVVEDRVNKPWRPIPQGKITSDQTRRLLLIAIPIILALNYILGAWRQGAFIHILTWLYNDLGGSDEVFVRELIIAVAYGFFNNGSLTVAIGPEYSSSTLGITWTVIVSGVILTTMQVQDLKDQEGDRTRGRKTIVLFLGERMSRSSIAFFVCFWSCVCMYFWGLKPMALSMTATAAAIVAMRVLFIRSQKGDARTWRLWCLWHASLYVLPVLMTLEDG
jgi:4-hydroxybenzoate polyprenyltransferase